MLYPPGIARQIKHHLLSERVDLDLTASSASSSTAGGCVDDREVLSFTKDVRAFHTAEYLTSTTKMIARDSTGRGNLLRQRTPGFLNYASARDSVCTSNTHYTQSRGQAQNQRWIYAPLETLITSSCNRSSNNLGFGLLAIYETRAIDFI